MLAIWSAERLLVPNIVEESKVLTKSTATYTWGSGGAITTTRPMKVVDAFIRDSDDQDTPVNVEMSLEEYNLVSDKTIEGRSDRLYYAPEYPLGKIHLDPVPDAAYTLKLFSWKPLASLATLATSISLPAEYEAVIVMSLAARLSSEYGIAMDTLTVQQAVSAHLTLRNLNRSKVGGARHDSAITWAISR